MGKFRVIGDIASELLAEIRGGKEPGTEAPGQVVQAYKQNELPAKEGRFGIGRIADLGASDEANKREALAPQSSATGEE